MTRPRHDSPPTISREDDARRLLEVSFDGIWVVAADLRTTFVNARMAELLGYSPEDMLGRHLYDFLFPEDVPAKQQSIARRRAGIREEFELRYRRKDGSELWTRIATAPILDGNGTFQGAVATHSDITHRRSIEQALQQRETELREAERLAQLGSWYWVPDADKVFWSEGLYQIAGRTPGSPAITYCEHPQLYTPESWARLDAAVKKALADGAPFQLDLELLRPDGSRRWVIARGEAQRNRQGRFTSLRGTVQDITERKLSELASQRLAAIVESSDDAIVSKDLNGLIMSWNSSATRMFGWKPEEIIGRSILTIIPPELHGEEDQILRRLRAGQRIDHYETERVTKDGRRLQLSITISPVRDSTGRVVGASKVARDITERKRADQALLTSEKLATAGRLAATVAHEINNPLESVVNLVYLAKTAPSLAAVQEYLAVAEDELNRVAQITKQTLGFYRERSAIVRSQVSELLRPLVSVFSSKAQNKGLRLVLDIASEAEILVDRTEFRQLLSNLIGNSIDACERGGIIRVRASIAHALAGEGLRVTVADNGSGIKSADQPHVFEPFYTTKKDVGTGLGLWVCKQIAEKYGGAIHMHSSTRPGHSGTVISVFLPVLVSGETAGQRTVKTAA